MSISLLRNVVNIPTNSVRNISFHDKRLHYTQQTTLRW